MEESFKILAVNAALLLEFMVVVMVLVGAIIAVVHIVRSFVLGSNPIGRSIRRVWLQFAAWILVSLEFALGADIIRTAIAPTWDDIGKLGAIAVIRTFLGFFLDRDMKSVEEIGAEKPESEAARI